MSLYEVICMLIRNSIPFSILHDGYDRIPNVIQVTVGPACKSFSNEEFHEVSQWMFDALDCKESS